MDYSKEGFLKWVENNRDRKIGYKDVDSSQCNTCIVFHYLKDQDSNVKEIAYGAINPSEYAKYKDYIGTFIYDVERAYDKYFHIAGFGTQHISPTVGEAWDKIAQEVLDECDICNN